MNDSNLLNETNEKANSDTFLVTGNCNRDNTQALSSVNSASNENCNQTNEKAHTQQIFHRSLLLNRPRSISFSESSTNSTIHLKAPPPSHSTNSGKEKENHGDIDDTWKEVSGKKRQRNSPEYESRHHKQSKLSSYWLSATVPTFNSFASLEDSEQQDHKDALPEKPIKPPPIFVDRVSNIQPLTKLLNETVEDAYEMKILRSEQVKIQPKTLQAYSTIVKELQMKNTEFHTYKPKQERSFRVVLKNIHPSTDISELKEAIEEIGHEVVNIWNIKNKQTKSPLSMFFVDLKPSKHNKEIYNTKNLLQCRIVFEAPRLKREIPQCANCQRYGHTRAFCHRKSRCVKCAENHPTTSCPRKERSDKVKCVLCNGNHPANYKGCAVFKEIQKAKFPPLRQRKPTNNSIHTKANIEDDKPQLPTHATYAETIKANNNTKPLDSNTQLIEPNQTQYKNNNNSSNNNQTPNSLWDLKELLQAMMNQMITISNLMGELMSKLMQNSMP